MTSRSSNAMLRLHQAPKNHTVHFGNLHPLDRDHVYEVKITGFYKCRKSDDDIQHDLGDLAMTLLRDAGHLHIACKPIGRWRISRGVLDAVSIPLFYRFVAP